MEIKVGSNLKGRYVVESRLGEGGFGVVWKATDEMLARPVAIKRLFRAFVDDHLNKEAAIKEAKTCAALQHQNIVQIFEVLDISDEILLLMEYVDGTSLANHLKQCRAGWISYEDADNTLAD